MAYQGRTRAIPEASIALPRESELVDLVILRRKVGVDHGGVDAPMAEPLRDLVDADALHDKVAGKGVA